MHTVKLSPDQFSKFIAGIIQDIESYSFDIFYDIVKIMNEYNKHRSISINPVKETLHLAVRSSGCDLIQPNDENYNIYALRSDRVYSLEFCWNYSYFYNSEVFCTITKIQ